MRRLTAAVVGVALAVTGPGLSFGTSVDAAAVIAAVPSITSFSPASPRPGDAVTVHGSNFGVLQGAGYVAFTDNGSTWGTPSSSYGLSISTWSNSAVTFTVPTRNGTHGATYVRPGTTATVVVHADGGSASSSANLPIGNSDRLQDYFTNIAISPDSDRGCSGADHVYLSANALAANTPAIVPGSAVTAGGFTFTWPSPANCYADSVQPGGQTILLPVKQGATKLGLLGMVIGTGSSGGSGTITVNYTTGNPQSLAADFGTWCDPAIQSGNTAVATMSYRNNGGAKDVLTCHVWLDSLDLSTSGRTVKSVTLPSGAVVNGTGTGANGGLNMRIFAIALNGTTTTSTSVSSDDGPSVWGQPVTFSATVSSNAGIPDGSVQFMVDGSPAGSAVALDGTGMATSAAISNLSIATHSITAVYGGTGSFITSTSGAINQVVSKAGTDTSVQAVTNPSALGQGVTFTATVSASPPGAGTPGGTVQFKDGTTDLGSPVALDGSGQAQSTAVADLAVGSHSITAEYGGDSDFTSSTSDAWSQAVDNTTSTDLKVDANPSVNGQSVTFTATVTSDGPVPTGTVQFKDGTASLGTPVTLDGGGAAQSPAVSGLSVGTHTVTAVYSGDPDANLMPSTSDPISQAVNQAGTGIAITGVSLATSTVVGQSYTVSWSVSVTPPGAGTPSGTVTVSGGGGCSAAVGAGQCSLTSTHASVDEQLRAHYGGDANFAASTSAAVSHTTNPAATSTSLSSSHDPSVFHQSVTFTATVTATSPGSGTPTGTVQFKVDGVSIGSAVSLDDSGVAHSAAISSLAVGGRSVTAVYHGDTDFAASTSSALTQTVHKADTSTALSSTRSQSVFGQGITFAATVSATPPGSGTPTGAVQFKVGNLNLGSPVALVNGVAHTTIANLSVGTRSISAVYSGSDDYAGSHSASLSQVVSKATTRVTLASALNPSVKGHGVKFTATIAIVSPGSGAISGQVQFTFDGASIGGLITLANGKAVLVIPGRKMTKGTHTVTARYLGSATLKTGTSATFKQTVKKG